MKKSTNFFSRVLLALMLSVGIVATSCEGADPFGGENTEQGSGDNNGAGDNDDSGNNEGGGNGGDEGQPGEGDNGGKDETDDSAGTSGAMTWSLDKVTEVSATFSGSLAVATSDLAFSQVTVYCSDAETFNVNDAQKVSTTTFDAEQKFTITVTSLTPGVKYNYCLIAEVKSEKTYGDVKDFTTDALVAPTLNAASEIAVVAATISGTVSLASGTASDLEYGFQYCTSDNFSSDVVSKKIKDIDSENKFSTQIASLVPMTTYYYRSYIKMNGVYGYGEIMSFTTKGITPIVPTGYTNLSTTATANCYIISQSGSYSFLIAKGNKSSELLHLTESASLLWESFGTSTAPGVGDLIKSVSYNDGYIEFLTADTFKEGNAVIAAKDASGNILWSWHIWFTDQPQGQEYYNNAGVMMDRNLGATSATPGDVGALGLLYQWGRKDPFLGSSSISSGTIAKSTITWPSTVSSNSSNGTIAYATAHPTTFIIRNSSNYDWYYTGSSSTDNTRWTTSESPKSIYDPCPSGWRVPDGGSNGVWSKALGSSSFTNSSLYSSSNKGMNFSGKFGSASTIWYPASGYRYYGGRCLSNVGNYGQCWSASPSSSNSDLVCFLGFGSNGFVNPSYFSNREDGLSVRCLQESK